VMRNVQNGNILGAILSASNTYNNAKKIKKKDVKAELKGIAKKGILEVGKQAGTIDNPIGAFSVGAVVAAGTLLASARGTPDNKTNQNNTMVTTLPGLDTVNFLGPDEVFKLISSDSGAKDEIAASLYFKDIGSRKGLTPAESNIEYEAASDSIKNVYTSKAITDVRKLVTEGYVKVPRQSQNVEIATEKAIL